MEMFKDLQRRCPAYLGLGESISELVILGTHADQRETMVSDNQSINDNINQSINDILIQSQIG